MVLIPSTLTTYDDKTKQVTLHITIKTIPSIGTRINMLDSLDEIDSLELHTTKRKIEIEPRTSDKKTYSVVLVDGECSKYSSGEIHIYCTRGQYVFNYMLNTGCDNIAPAIHTTEENKTPFDIG